MALAAGAVLARLARPEAFVAGSGAGAAAGAAAGVVAGEVDVAAAAWPWRC